MDGVSRSIDWVGTLPNLGLGGAGGGGLPPELQVIHPMRASKQPNAASG